MKNYKKYLAKIVDRLLAFNGQFIDKKCLLSILIGGLQLQAPKTSLSVAYWMPQNFGVKSSRQQIGSEV